LTLTIENHLASGRQLSDKLPSEPQIRHIMEQLIEIRNKIKEQFDVNSWDSFLLYSFLCFLKFTNQQFEELVERFNISLNEHNHLEKHLTTILRDVERCLSLSGENFTQQTRKYLNVKKNNKIFILNLSIFCFSKEYQTIQRSIIIDLQKLSDHNLLLSSDIKATEYLQERHNHLREIHLNLEQKSNHLRVCISK
jgi:hypothetical protein